jgi:large subunit ribosomal protein L28
MQPRYQLLSGRLSTPRVVLSSQPVQRTYATAVPTPIVKNPLQRRKGGDLGSHLPKHVIPADSYIPAYPYGDHALFKQANRGLYGDQMIQFGNNVSHKTETKTRRYWKPNVLSKSLYSVALKKKIKLRITSNVLKTMDREGGLDEYLLKDNEHRLKELGPLGWALRWTLLQKPEVISRMRAEAAALGLDQATIDAQWPTPEMLAGQKVTQQGLVKAEDLIPEEYEDGAEDDIDSAELIEGEEHEATPPHGKYFKSNKYTPAEKRRFYEARTEYTKAVKASARYLSRDLVDSTEAGLKLAFIRAPERAEAATRLKKNFSDKLNQLFSPADVETTRAKFNLPATLPDSKLKRIAYNQWRRSQIELAGSPEAWRNTVDGEKALEREAQYEEAGGNEAIMARKKLEYADMIAEAETAPTNEGMEEKRRRVLVQALEKAGRADRVAKAKAEKGESLYARMTVEEMRARGGLAQGERKTEEKTGSDAWAALLDATNRTVENRPSA